MEQGADAEIPQHLPPAFITRLPPYSVPVLYPDPVFCVLQLPAAFYEIIEGEKPRNKGPAEYQIQNTALRLARIEPVNAEIPEKQREKQVNIFVHVFHPGMIFLRTGITQFIVYNDELTHIQIPSALMVSAVFVVSSMQSFLELPNAAENPVRPPVRCSSAILEIILPTPAGCALRVT